MEVVLDNLQNQKPLQERVLCHQTDSEFKPAFPISQKYQFPPFYGDIIDITDSVNLGEDNTLDFDILLANGSVYNNTSPVDLLPYTII